MNESLLSRFEATEAKVSKKRYVVELSTDERKRLEELIGKGKSPAKKQRKTRWSSRSTLAWPNSIRRIAHSEITSAYDDHARRARKGSCTTAMFQNLALMGALAERHLVDPAKVADWAEFFADGMENSTGNVPANLKRLREVIARMRPGCGRE
jgi:hypothetical protein